MNELKTWTFSGSEVRTILVNGDPWWVLSDVCKVLELSNPTVVANRLEEDERSKFDLGRQGDATIINESGLYSVILRSDKPQAKPFRRWVTSDVLPTIRKTGQYTIESRDSYQIDDPIERAKRWIEEEQERKQLKLTVNVQSQQIAEMKPKASYYDLVLNCKDLVSVHTIAKDYGKSPQWLNKFLNEHGIQYKQGNIWFLYQKYAEQGYTNTKTQPYTGNNGEMHSKVHTYWTQKGRLFIYDVLKANGILPVIERDKESKPNG